MKIVGYSDGKGGKCELLNRINVKTEDKKYGNSHRNEKWVVRWLFLSVPVLGIISILDGLSLTFLVPTVKHESIPQLLI